MPTYELDTQADTRKQNHKHKNDHYKIVGEGIAVLNLNTLKQDEEFLRALDEMDRLVTLATDETNGSENP